MRFVQYNHVDIAFLDIAMGRTSGIDLCERMTEINPKLNVVFLTTYPEYSLRSWDTHACGFLVKLLVPEEHDLHRANHEASSEADKSRGTDQRGQL